MAKKSKVIEAEVVETCLGMRKDGTCGNGMSDNHNNPCRGCGCPDRKQYEQNYGREIAVAAQNRDGIVKTIARQIEAVRGAELRSTFEKLKLGAMVKQAVTLLGLEGRGRGNVGIGVKGWWDENFKGEDGQPVIEYKTLMRWISAAEKIPTILGGSAASDPDGVMKLLVKDPEQVVGKEAKILKSAEKVANGMTMRQMLLWGDDEEPRRPGRPKGSGKPTPENYAAVHKTAAENAATAYAIVWGELDKKRQLPNLASLLKVEDARDILALVEPVYHALKKRVGEEER